jgi:hypothetical protein
MTLLAQRLACAPSLDSCSYTHVVLGRWLMFACLADLRNLASHSCLSTPEVFGNPLAACGYTVPGERAVNVSFPIGCLGLPIRA